MVNKRPYNSNEDNYNKTYDGGFVSSESGKLNNYENKNFTKVFHGSTEADNEILKFIYRTERKIDACISSNAPSVIIEVDEIKNARVTAVKERKIKLRYVTEITTDNLEYCKEMLTFSEIRHLDGMKGNFEVADESEYVAVAVVHEAQSLPQLIFSNVPEIVEQQQFVFDSFWNRAIPAEQRIKEIQEGIVSSVTTVFNDYKQAENKEFEMIKTATKEIQIIYSTANAFHLQEKRGTLELLKQMADQNKKLQISILVPIDSSIKKSLSLQLLNKTINKNIQIQDIAPSIDIKIKSLVVDRKESLVMELKHLQSERLIASIGFSIYSNSLPIVLSFASIFEVIYNQSFLFEQLRQEGELKDEFVNLAAHELRTPIMPIINGLEILEEKLGTRKSEFQKELDIITRNASRLEMLAESILQVSRIESGNFHINIEKNIDIHSLISQVIEDIHKKYLYTDKLNGIMISFLPFYNIGESNLGDGNTANSQEPLSLLVNCDPDKFRQVVFNLLDNAVRFTFQGKIVVSTLLTTVSDYFNKDSDVDNKSDDRDTVGDDNYNNPYNEENKSIEFNKMVIVSVQNEGVGVDPKIKDQLFEKFATKSAQGTGIGLYLSKKIVEAHEGMIWMEEYDYNLKNDLVKNEKIGDNKIVHAETQKRKKRTILKFAFPISNRSERANENWQ
ncbi:MAG TPA: HAMP domain-containing sensor histidine kinase [Candidatus Saccharimonadales bacterium]|nr:HAMP domain-containing sensor histidine kinase [Candidatus Saccharimonadales bacterium]